MRSAWLAPLDDRRSSQDPGAYDSPPFSTVRQGLAALDAEGPEGLCEASLRDDIAWLASVQRAAEAMSARWLAALDRRVHEVPDGDPINRTATWLHDTLHLTPGAAHAQLRTARTLERLPRTAAAFRAGKLSAQQVSVVCQAVDQSAKTSLDTGEVEAAMLDGAEDLDPKQLLKSWHSLRYRADQEAGLRAEQEQQRHSYLHLRERWDGAFELEGLLDAEGGTILKTALKGVLGPRSRDDDRTPSERRAAGLVDLARWRLEAGDLPLRGGERPQLTLVARLETLRLEKGSPLAELDWGPLVSGETARRIACDASVTPVLVSSEGEILHVGRRRRTLPAATRRALNLRDRGCRWPGCTAPPQECEPHHIVHVADGGSDDLSNVRLHCSYHHRLLHPENDRFRAGAGQGRAP